MKRQFRCPDLTRRPPRGFRVRLGGFVILAQMLDKGRAMLAKKNGKYRYNCTSDQHLVHFLGFDPVAMLKELASGKTDGEMLEWLLCHSETPRDPWEIEAWSAFMQKHTIGGKAKSLALFTEYLNQYSKTRADIETWVEIQRVRRAVTRSDTTAATLCSLHQRSGCRVRQEVLEKASESSGPQIP